VLNPLVLLIAGVVFVMVLVVLAALMADERRLRVQERVKGLQRPRSPLAEELALPFHQRVLGPILGNMSRSIGALAPAEALDNARIELERAGNPAGLNAHSFTAIRMFSALAGVFAAVWFYRLPGMQDSNLQMPLAGLMFLIGALGPQYMLTKNIEARHAQIRKALPDIIDLLVVSVEAGAGLDGALAEVCQRKDGPLPDEFARLLGEIRVGKTRQQAWEDMAARVDEDNLSALVAALAQAEELGVSIAKALRTQSDSLRTRRSLQIREIAAALPVKLLFPLIFFIFPALFVILLGPGLLSMTEVLGVLGGG
jgi:tight adherence protein C